MDKSRVGRYVISLVRDADDSQSETKQMEIRRIKAENRS